jgi:hypothetical protein
MFGCMEIDDSEMFLDTDALPHVHCRWHDRRKSGRLLSQQTCSLHHESNTSNHFNCSELSTSSDCLYGAVVGSRDTAYATHWIRIIAYPSVRQALLIVACFLLITAFLGFLHSRRYRFTLRPMLIGTFCLIGGGEYPGKVCDIGFETHDRIPFIFNVFR